MTVLSVRMGVQFRWVGRYPSGRWREVLQVWEEIHVSGSDLAMMGLPRSFSFDLNVIVSGANLLRAGRVRDNRFAFVTYRHPTKGALGIWGSNLSGSELHLTHELGARAGVALINETALGALSWPS